MKITKILIFLLLFALLATGCTPKGSESVVSGYSSYTYADFKTPENENLGFGRITIGDESDKTRAINMKNPAGELPAGDCIVFINSDYEKDLVVPENAYAISIKNAHINYYTVISTDLKNIGAKSGDYLIFTGEYNIAFAKTVYSVGKEIRLINISAISTVSYYPSVKIGDKLLKINGNKANAVPDSDGIYLSDAAYGSGYVTVSAESFLQVAIIDDKVAYICSPNQLAAIPDKNGYLVTFIGLTALAQANGIVVGQEAESIYLTVTEGSAYTLKIGDSVVGGDYINETRDAGRTVLYNNDFRYAGTHTNRWGYEYVVSNGVVTAVTVPDTDTSGNATIPEDGFVISALPDSPQFKSLSKLKVGDKVELILPIGNEYSVSTIPFNCYNDARQAEYIVLYNSKYGASTRTNEWGYEIIVDNKGKIIGEDGDGNASIPENGTVISGVGGQKNVLLKAYRLGATVSINDAEKTFTIMNTPMQNYDNALSRFQLLKESVENARKELLDIGYNGIDTMIKVLDATISKINASSGVNLSDLRNTFINEVDKLSNLIIPSLAVENRGAWHVLSEYSDDEVEHTVKAAVALGLNYIIIDSWRNGYAYYRSSLDGVLMAPEYADFDPLEAFVRIGHQYGLEIHSSFSTFMAGGHNYEYPVNHPTQRKGWLTLSKNGYDYGINGDGEFYTLDPYNPEVRAYLISIFKEVAGQYAVDGIHYDYIRFPQPSDKTGDFGYNESIIRDFQKKYKTSVNPKDLNTGENLWNEWCQFRCDIVSSFVKECTAAIKKANPAIQVSAAVFAGMDEMKTSIFQDARSWVEGGYIDSIFPMNYTPSATAFKQYGDRALSITKGKANDNMGIGTFERYPNDAVLWEVEYARENNAGSCFFTLDSLLTEQYKDFIADGIFKRKAVTTYSEESFNVAVNDLIRRIDEIYIPLTDGYTDKLTELKTMLGTMTKSNMDIVITYAKANLSDATLARVIESLDFIKDLSVRKGYILK